MEEESCSAFVIVCENCGKDSTYIIPIRDPSFEPKPGLFTIYLAKKERML